METKLVRVGDIEREYGITRKTLRYWEDHGLIRSQSIGTHHAYGPADVERILTVNALRGAGYTPKQLAGILRAGDVVPTASKTEDEVYRSLLAQSSKEHKQVEFSTPSTRAYNSAYKRLRRLADQMGLLVFMKKEGSSLEVRARKK